MRHGPAELARWRRIVQYPHSTHYGEVKVSPQWHQWLRHMRERPPSIQEQHAELQRQHQMKHLAADADARWAAKPRMMDAPGEGNGHGQPVPALESRAATRAGADNKFRKDEGTDENANVSGEEQIAPLVNSKHKETGKEDPWKRQPRAGPSEDWQPQAWAPPAAKR